MQSVWIVSTPLGDAVRSAYDVEELLPDGRVRLKPSSCTTFIPREIPLGLVTVGTYAPSDMPDFHRCATEISNVCGFVAGFSSLNARHPAWRGVRSTLGYFKEAYSLRGGNLVFLRGKLIFKGATSRNGVYKTVVRLIAEPSEPVLKAYLIIATAYMRRNLFVNGGCLVEQLLSRFSWCRVMRRWGWSFSFVFLAHINARLPGPRRCPTPSFSTSKSGPTSPCQRATRRRTWAPSPCRGAASSTSGSAGTTAWCGTGTRGGLRWSTACAISC